MTTPPARSSCEGVPYYRASVGDFQDRWPRPVPAPEPILDAEEFRIDSIRDFEKAVAPSIHYSTCPLLLRPFSLLWKNACDRYAGKSARKFVTRIKKTIPPRFFLANYFSGIPGLEDRRYENECVHLKAPRPDGCVPLA